MLLREIWGGMYQEGLSDMVALENELKEVRAQIRLDGYLGKQVPTQREQQRAGTWQEHKPGGLEKQLRGQCGWS